MSVKCSSFPNPVSSVRSTSWVILFDDFETLDVFGPIEVLGRLKQQFNPKFRSANGGIVMSSHKVRVVTQPPSDLKTESYILLVPGGMGTRWY